MSHFLLLYGLTLSHTLTKLRPRPQHLSEQEEAGHPA